MKTFFFKTLFLFAFSIMPFLIYGQINNDKIEIEEVKYDDDQLARKGKITQFKNGNLKGFHFQISKEILITAEYEHLEHYYSDFIIAKKNGKNGIIDGRGKTIIPFEFDNITKPMPAKGKNMLKRGGGFNYPFQWFVAGKDGKWGMIDSLGNAVVPIECDRGQWVNDSLALFYKDSLLRIIDPNGKVVFEETFTEWEIADKKKFRDYPLIRATKNGQVGLIDLYGKTIVPFRFKKIKTIFQNSIIVQQVDEKYGLFNFQGEETIPAKYKYLNFIMADYLMAQDFENEKTGVINTNGKIIIPFKYNNCTAAKAQGRALTVPNNPFITVRHKEELFAIYDTTGKQLTKMIWKEVFSLSNDLLAVKSPDKKWQILDRNGEYLTDEPVDNFKSYATMISLTKNGKDAFLTPTGKRVTDFKYHHIYGYSRERTATQVAKDLKLPSDIKLLGSGMTENRKQVFIGTDGKEYFPH